MLCPALPQEDGLPPLKIIGIQSKGRYDYALTMIANIHNSVITVGLSEKVGNKDTA